ncbi:MAG: hypothetical protein EOP76_22855 [Variovorax sp.]|nr:MAG: hypothetical protein EOP76_22855 [Variovorax sp.]
MPDEVEINNLIMPIGYRSSQCNALYYDPNRVYSLPKNAGQASLPTPSFNSARYNYYSTTDTTLTDLRTQFRAYDRNTRAISVANNGEDPPQAAYYYVYSGTATLTYRSGTWRRTSSRRRRTSRCRRCRPTPRAAPGRASS